MKKIVSLLLALVMSFTAVSFMETTAYAAKSTDQQIEELENNIKSWQAEYDKLAAEDEKALKGVDVFINAEIVCKDPLIVFGRVNLFGAEGYYHIIGNTQKPDIGTLFGYFSGKGKPLGTSTYSYEGRPVADYQYVDVKTNTDRRTELEEKINEAKEKLNRLKIGGQTKIKLNASTMKVKVGKSAYIDYDLYCGSELVNPSSATVTWKSGNKSIATVNSSGLVKGKKPGTVTLTGTVKESGKSVKLKVTVIRDATGISLNSSKVSLKVGSHKKLKATLTPSDSNVGVTWSSTNEYVAEVSSNGYVTAKAPGTSYIVACTDNGYFEGCKITVKGKAEEISVPKSAGDAIGILSNSKLHDFLNRFDYTLYAVKETKNYYKVFCTPCYDEFYFIDCLANYLGQGYDSFEDYDTYYVRKSDGAIYIDDPDRYGKLKRLKEIKSLEFGDDEIYLENGSTYNILGWVITNPERYLDTITFTSSDTSLVRVNEDGSITALSDSGEVIITATTSTGITATIIGVLAPGYEGPRG